MAYCAKCGAQIGEGVAFCGSCGAPVGAPAAGGATPAASAGASTAAMAPNVAGLLAYILGLITGIIFLVLEPYKNDKFVRFHAFQSIFLHVAVIAFWILWMIVWGILGAVTGGILGLVSFPLGMLIGLGIFALWIFLMYKAYNNERYMLPYIGAMAAKQAG